MGRWQYHALSVPDRVWIDRDLPLQGVSLGPALSGPFALKASIDPTYEPLRGPGGELLLREHGTLIVAERDDQVFGAALITDITTTGDHLELDCAGHSSLAAGETFEGTKTWGGKTAGTTGHGVDALDVVRHLWTWLQSQPDANLDVHLGATSTPYVLGAWHNARKIGDDGTLGPAAEINDPIVFDGVWDKTSRKPAAARGKTVYWQHTLGWWDNLDIAARMDELAKQTPFDYVETAAWSDAEKTDVVLGIRFGYPRVGSKRVGPVFIEGENLVALPALVGGRGSYANRVTVHGAGEGATQLRGSASVRDGRLRRTVVIEAAHLTSAAACKALAQDALERRRRMTDVTTLTVTDHPSAPIGAYAVGDDILVQSSSGWRTVSLWVRITALDIDPATEVVTITCSRSDAWDYSGGDSQQ